MANNCLVTKLKGVVDNNNLPYFNGLKINYHSGYAANNRVISFFLDHGSLTIKSEHPVMVYNGVTLVGNGVTDFTTPEVTKEQIYIQFPDANGVCNVISKFTINTIGYNYQHPSLGNRSDYTSYTIDVSQLDYATNIQEFRVFSPSFEGVFNPEKFNGISIFVTGNMSADKFDSYKMDIAKLSNNINMDKLNCKGSRLVYGNLETLGVLINLTQLVLWGTNVTGDVKNLCDNLVANGKTSGTILFDVVATDNVTRTWDGELLTYDKVKELNNDGSKFIFVVEFGSSYTGGYRIVPQSA